MKKLGIKAYCLSVNWARLIPEGACHKDFGSVNYYTDPLIFGRYPEEFESWQRECGFRYPASHMEIIKSKHVFMALTAIRGTM